MNSDIFVSRFFKLARIVEKQYRIPALVTLSQAAVESAWGTKAPGNNFFGIKAGSGWTGKTQELLTTEIVTPEQLKQYKKVHTATRLNSGKYKIRVYEKFRVYNDPADCFHDYGRLISNGERYKPAFQYTDPYKFARAIAAARYASATNYFETLKLFMDEIKKKFKHTQEEHREGLAIL